MKKDYPWLMSILGICTAAVFLIVGFLLYGELDDHYKSVLFSMGGSLLGASGGTLLTLRKSKSLTPEQRRETEIMENDERNVTIQEKAAMDSWYCTAIVLSSLWVVSLFTDGGKLGEGLLFAAALLHCIIYLVHLVRWSKKL